MQASLKHYKKSLKSTHLIMDIRQINVFVPCILSGSHAPKNIHGYFIDKGQDCLDLYIICKQKDFVNSKNPVCCLEWHNLLTQHQVPGLFSYSDKAAFKSDPNLFCLNCEDNQIVLNYLRVDHVEFDLSTVNIFVFSYDHKAFLKSEDDSINTFEDKTDLIHSNPFALLNVITKHSNGSCWRKQCSRRDKESNDFHRACDASSIVRLFKFLCNYSNLFIQLGCFLSSISWIIQSVRVEKMISIKTGNLIISILVDFLCGLLLLCWINQLNLSPIEDFYYMIEMIVNNLQLLVEWLMGSPAGLKLNHAFNTMLGKFFSYHIGLWWMFLVIIKSFLQTALSILQCIGMLGLTFQTAILTDLLSLSSFHVYCIYTYAARLYNIQISGLVALCRLFLGRKHNPLRGGVDSCEYNHHQLFVGTIAFTILLFLLPTTFLYYVVFTTFRVTLVLLGGFLTRLRYFLQSLPLYVMILWFCRSNRLAGEINITTLDAPVSGTMVGLNITLKSGTLYNSILKYHPPPVKKPDAIKWKQLFMSLCRGDLLYPV